MSTTTTSNIHHHHPPPPSYYNPSWTLVSQGAEARIWFIPNFISIQQDTSASPPAICKERFKKAYRHESLDKTLIKSRTKAEARNVVKCQKAGIHTPAIYSVHLNLTSACLFMEYIPGCTVKQYLETHVYTYTNVYAASEHDKSQENSEYNEDDDNDGEPMEVTVDDSTDSEPITTATTNPSFYTSHKVIVDTHSLDIAHAMGVIIATMHHANIIHGDLTTSNIMIRNPPLTSSDPSLDNTLPWKPQLVLIDLGLSSTCSSSSSSTSYSKMKKDGGGGSVSGQEDKAVDLYVMERAFQTTHPGSEPLISHLLLAYQQTTDTLMLQKGHCESSSSSKKNKEEEGDCVMQVERIDKSSTRTYGQSILERLNQVRLRGRKRECFG